MHRITIGILAGAAILLGAAASASAAEKKCYETKLVEGGISCSGMDNNSADFGRGCSSKGSGFEEVEVACPTGEWVNVSQETQFTYDGKRVTQAQICKIYGMVSAQNNGKVCASGQRPASSGTGWASINYRYGKDKVTPRDGGNILKPISQTTTEGLTGKEITRQGTMCYDTDMDERNNTDKDALVAVFCK